MFKSARAGFDSMVRAKCSFGPVQTMESQWLVLVYEHNLKRYHLDVRGIEMIRTLSRCRNVYSISVSCNYSNMSDHTWQIILSGSNSFVLSTQRLIILLLKWFNQKSLLSCIAVYLLMLQVWPATRGEGPSVTETQLWHQLDRGPMAMQGVPGANGLAMRCFG